MDETDVKPWVSRAVRVGYAAKGLIYSLIGLLALRVAFGMQGGRLTDASGVLLTVLRQRFGLVLLTVIGAGILAYAGYYIFEAVADLRRKGGDARGWFDRALTIVKALVYGAIGVEALGIVFLHNRSASNAEDNARFVMRFPLGDLLLIVIGIGVAIYGLSQLRRTWRGTVDEDIDAAQVRREARWILTLGRIGTAARSVILLIIGGTMAASGMRERPADADGYTEALTMMASYHPWLLMAMGAGLLCFGIYQLCHARYAKIAIA